MMSAGMRGSGAGAVLVCLASSLAFSQSAVEQRWPAPDDSGVWATALSYAKPQQSPDPFGGKSFTAAPSLPAESGVNYTLTPIGGYLNPGSGAGSRGLAGVGGTVALPVGHSFGLLSGFDGGSWGGSGFYSGGSMLYWRDPNVGLVGLSGAGGHVNAFGDANFGSSALSAEGYWGRFTPFASGGVFGTNLTKTVGMVSGGLGYYPVDNLQLSVGGFDVGGLAGASAGIEYLLPQPIANVPTSIFANGFAGNHGASGAVAGLHFMIGPVPKDKTLIRRRREDDPGFSGYYGGPLQTGLNDFGALLGRETLFNKQPHFGAFCTDGEDVSSGCTCQGFVIGGQCSLPSDIRLKRDIVRIARLDNGLGLYRFRYLNSDEIYVGVMAQEVALIRPDAVELLPDGYHLRVIYARLGMKLQTWEEWTVTHDEASEVEGKPNERDGFTAACYRPDAPPPHSTSLNRQAAWSAAMHSASSNGHFSSRRGCSPAI
jgi:hypothetical protein